jgi:SAM-dependent methyltransferase
MSRIDYDDRAATAFVAGRHLPPAGLDHWRAAITRHLAPTPRMRVLDLGAGTGMWAAALAGWFDITVVAVEPSAAMRARSSCPVMIAGDGLALPLGAASMDGAWLSTVVHHLPDLRAAARELGRVLRPGAPVLIRSAFAGRCQQIGLVRYWPETAAVLDSYPTATEVQVAFETAGFGFIALEPVPQVTADSTAAVAATLRREAHTPLMLISDTAYQAGLARLRAAAASGTGPVIDTLDLLILHNADSRARDGDDAPSRSPGSGAPR